MTLEFDYGNARHNVPSSFLRCDDDREYVAPGCRGYWWDGVLVPLSIADDTLAEQNGVPQGTHWNTPHDWNAERDMYLRGNRVRQIDPQRAADIIATDRKCHCHWDEERGVMVTWPLRDWEKIGARIVNWANEIERESNVDGNY